MLPPFRAGDMVVEDGSRFSFSVGQPLEDCFGDSANKCRKSPANGGGTVFFKPKLPDADYLTNGKKKWQINICGLFVRQPQRWQLDVVPVGRPACRGSNFEFEGAVALICEDQHAGFSVAVAWAIEDDRRIEVVSKISHRFRRTDLLLIK